VIGFLENILPRHAKEKGESPSNVMSLPGRRGLSKTPCFRCFCLSSMRTPRALLSWQKIIRHRKRPGCNIRLDRGARHLDVEIPYAAAAEKVLSMMRNYFPRGGKKSRAGNLTLPARPRLFLNYRLSRQSSEMKFKGDAHLRRCRHRRHCLLWRGGPPGQ
jgi:hypothetical protein